MKSCITKVKSHAAGVAEGATGSYGFTVSQFVGPALFGGITDYHTLELIERIGMVGGTYVWYLSF